MKNSYALFTTRDTRTGTSKDGVAASGTDTYYSDPWSSVDGWSLQVVTSGTLTGTWTLWASNKMNPDPATDTDWVDISTHPGFVETNPAGAATKWMATPDHLPGLWFRLKYVNASGTGNLYAYAYTPGS